MRARILAADAGNRLFEAAFAKAVQEGGRGAHTQRSDTHCTAEARARTREGLRGRL